MDPLKPQDPLIPENRIDSSDSAPIEQAPAAQSDQPELTQQIELEADSLESEGSAQLDELSSSGAPPPEDSSEPELSPPEDSPEDEASTQTDDPSTSESPPLEDSTEPDASPQPDELSSSEATLLPEDSTEQGTSQPPDEPLSESNTNADPVLHGPLLNGADPPKPWLRYYPDEVAPTIDYSRGSLGDFLTKAAEKYPNNEAIHFLGKSVCYRELYEHACRLANGLISLGINKGDRVAIMLPNCPQAVAAYFGTLLLGAVVVQTNPLYVERELEHQLSDSGASALITVDLLYARVARVRGERPEAGPLPQLKHVIVTSIKDGLPFPKNLLYPLKQRKEGFRPDIPYGSLGVVAYRRLLSANSHLPVVSSINSEDLAVLQYTGGTTGTPKGVMLTHRNLVANTLQISKWCYKAQDGKERFLAALPLFHVFGVTVLMNMSVLRAGSLILLPRFEAETVLQTISKRKPTIFPGAPTMYVALINHKLASETDLSSIEVCISGSAALPLEVQEQFEALTGGRLIEGFGLTEASPVLHANPIWGRRKIGTIGLPLPDTDVIVVDPAGKVLPSGEIGEIVARGPQVMKGYWNHPEETARTLRDGWLYTGDLGYMDEEGYFIIVDRMKDVIIAGGFNVYPRDVEEVLYEHPAILEAAAVGVKDPYRGETVKAFIVLKKEGKVTAEELNLWCRERLAAYKVPHLYEFRETLPKTMIGKVLRRKLQEEEMEKATPK